MSGTDRNGRGVFDCPIDDCHEAIVGSYGDLLDHVRDEHPLERIMVDEDRNTVLDRIKQAQKEELKKDINEHMMVGSKPNRDTANGDNS